MAFASGVFGATLRDALKNVIALDWTAAGNKVALYTNTDTPNFSADPASYAATNEVAGTGYTAGGQVLASPTLTIATGVLTLDGADTVWTTTTLSGIRGLKLYADALTPKALILAINFGADYNTVAGNLTLQYNAAGLTTSQYA